MKKLIDLRSDTVTQPTPEMREAIFNAKVGDDVVQEDPTVNRLEKLAADMLGKEAALLVPSGTFGNQLCLLTHCSQGDEVVLAENSHIVQHEAGASSVISSVQLRPIPIGTGLLTWELLKSRIRLEEDIHYPPTGLIELENAVAEGNVYPVEVQKDIYTKAKLLSIPVHLDGARIFNAAVHLKVNPREIARQADSVMFCLSKGLCSPVGSLVCGTRSFINKARNMRKLMGGGMRQAGIIAAAGIVSLKKMTKRLKDDHRRAKQLALAMAEYPDVFEVQPELVKINMFFMRLKKNSRKNQTAFYELLKGSGILTYPAENDTFRFVTHHDISDEDLDYMIRKLPSVVKGLR